MDTKECEDRHEVGEEGVFLSNLMVRSRWTNLSTKVVEVKISEFENLCETGDAVPVVVSGLTSDGFMFNDTTEEESEYGCVDSDQGDIVAWICSGKLACPSKSCIEKCCKEDQVLDAYGRCFKAENQTNLWSLQDLDTFNGTFENVVIRNSFFQDLLDNHPRLSYCEGYFLEPGDVYKITENGSLSHVGHALTMDYCIDNVAENGSLATKVVRCARLDNPICNNTDVCFNSSHAPFYPEEVENKLKDTSLLIFMSICGVISLICLAFTFLVYWIIPGFNNLHGKIVQSNIISIAILTVYLLIVFNA